MNADSGGPPCTEPIGQLEYFLIVATAVVAGGVYIWPALILQDAGIAAILVVPLSLAMALVSTWAKSAWRGYLGAQSYAGLLQATLGTLIGRVALLVVTVFYLGLYAVLIALYAQTLRTFFYPTTPLWALSALLLTVGAYLATRELHVVARTVQLWFPLVIAGVLLLVALSLQNAHLWAALVPPQRIELAPVFQGAITMWYLWLQAGIMATVSPSVRGADPRRLRALAMWAITAQGAILLILYAIVTATVGPDAAMHLRFPVVYIFSNTRMAVSFIPRVGLFILFSWTAAMVLNLAVQLFAFSWNLGLAFREGGKLRTVFVAIMAVCIWLGASALPTPDDAIRIVRSVLSPVGLLLEAAPEVLIAVWLALRVAWRRRSPRELRSGAGGV